MMEANSTKKSGQFPGNKKSLFGLNKKLKGLFSFICNKLCPPRTLVIHNIDIWQPGSKEDVDKALEELHTAMEKIMRRGSV